MTVKELIAKLSEYPEDMYVDCWDATGEIVDVNIVEPYYTCRRQFANKPAITEALFIEGE